MAKSYSIDITNGKGIKAVTNGSYNATIEATGYDNTSLSPKSITVTNDVNEYNFSISATGTLTLHVTEDGTTSGTPIVGATFYRCDSTGTTYGDIITTNTEGNAIFNYVPFDTTSGITIYYKQTASDDSHNFDDTVKSLAMDSSTKTIEIVNAPAAIKTFNLLDANYANLPIATATITITE